jgi:hypothetical protein
MKFDSIFIKFRSSTSEAVEIKVGADGAAWRKAFLSIDEMRSDFWNVLTERTQAATIPVKETSPYTCPNCKTTRLTFLRAWENGRYFCGFCGAHLRKKDDGFVTIRTIDEMK